MSAFAQLPAVIEPTTEAPSNRSIAVLISCYKTDPDSPYKKLRYATRTNYDGLMARIERDHGIVDVRDIRARSVKRWHEVWLGPDNHVAMAHALVGMFRTLATYGATLLECQDCRALKVLLHDMRFEMCKPRGERLTAEQAIQVRAKAHELGMPSIALAQAFQFEAMLRQKDVIGEMVPLTEPGVNPVIFGDMQWHRGLRWSEIDAQMVLTHVTSKRQKEITVDLKLAPMVVEELRLLFASPAGASLAARSPNSPIIINELTGEPYRTHQYRRAWRTIARACGIPDDVKNMDSRAGAISEATDAGADLEHVRHAATHSDIGMTQKYSRGSADKVAGVQRKRTAHRNANALAAEPTQLTAD